MTSTISTQLVAYVPVVCRIPFPKFPVALTTCESISCAYFISINVCCSAVVVSAPPFEYMQIFHSPVLWPMQTKSHAFRGFSYAASVRSSFRQHFSSIISSNVPRRSLSWPTPAHFRPFALVIVSLRALMEFISRFLHTNIVPIGHVSARCCTRGTVSHTHIPVSCHCVWSCVLLSLKINSANSK